MTDGTITCPLCHGAFELTADKSLIIVAKLRQQTKPGERKLAAEPDAAERALVDKSAATERPKASVEGENLERLSAERPAIPSAKGRKARAAPGESLDIHSGGGIGEIHSSAVRVSVGTTPERRTRNTRRV